MSVQLTAEQGYLAMFAFIEKRFSRLPGADELAMMLGDLSITPDGSTADPASWTEWLESIEASVSGQVDARRQTPEGVPF